MVDARVGGISTGMEVSSACSLINLRNTVLVRTNAAAAVAAVFIPRISRCELAHTGLKCVLGFSLLAFKDLCRSDSSTLVVGSVHVISASAYVWYYLHFWNNRWCLPST